MRKQEENRQQSHDLRMIKKVGIWSASIMLAFCIIFPLILGSFAKLDDAGSFGDQYGALNTLFSGLAFVGLIIAILLQREDLKLQREDLFLQREEMQKARAESELQTKIYKDQADLMASQLENSRKQFEAQWEETVRQNKIQREMLYIQGRNFVIKDIETRKNNLSFYTYYFDKTQSVSNTSAIHEFIEQFYFLATICMELSADGMYGPVHLILEGSSQKMYEEFHCQYSVQDEEENLEELRSKYKYYQFYTLDGIACILRNLAMISHCLTQADSWIKRMAKIEKGEEDYEQYLIDNLTMEETTCLYISRLYIACQNNEINQNQCKRYIEKFQYLYGCRQFPNNNEMLLDIIKLKKPSINDIYTTIERYIPRDNPSGPTDPFDFDDLMPDSDSSNTHN